MYDQPLGGAVYQDDGQPGGPSQPLGDGQPGGPSQGTIYVTTSVGQIPYTNKKFHVPYSSQALRSENGHTVLANLFTTAREGAYDFKANHTTKLQPKAFAASRIAFNSVSDEVHALGLMKDVKYYPNLARGYINTPLIDGLYKAGKQNN